MPEAGDSLFPTAHRRRPPRPHRRLRPPPRPRRFLLMIRSWERKTFSTCFHKKSPRTPGRYDGWAFFLASKAKKARAGCHFRAGFLRYLKFHFALFPMRDIGFFHQFGELTPLLPDQSAPARHRARLIDPLAKGCGRRPPAAWAQSHRPLHQSRVFSVIIRMFLSTAKITPLVPYTSKICGVMGETRLVSEMAMPCWRIQWWTQNCLPPDGRCGR